MESERVSGRTDGEFRELSEDRGKREPELFHQGLLIEVDGEGFDSLRRDCGDVDAIDCDSVLIGLFTANEIRPIRSQPI